MARGSKLDLVKQYVATHKIDTKQMSLAHRKLWLQQIDPLTKKPAKRSPP